MKSNKIQEHNKYQAVSLSTTELKNVMEKGYVPGMSIAYIDGGKFDHALSLGVANTKSETPVTAETIFWACSLSKPVFAYLVIKLIEEGTLPENFLKLPLSDYLKSLSLNLEYDTHFKDEAPMQWRNMLTARMILEHQTGLPNWAEKGIGDDVLNFKSEPGKEFTYSGEGLLYLQKVIEKVTGKSLNELANEKIFKPLEMNHSSFLYPDETKIVSSYHDEAMDPIDSPKGYGNDNNAAGSLHTSTSDYARFLVACLNDINFIEIANKLLEPINDGETVEKGLNKKALSHVYWYLGFGVQKINDEITLFHWGHGNGVRTFFAINMNSKSGVVFFTNCDNGLSIAPYIVTHAVGNLQYALDWLFIKEDYKTFDALGWEKYHTALMLERNEDYQGAIALFTELQSILPEDKIIKNRIVWLETLNQIKTSPVSVSREILKEYEGEYGPLKITLKGSELQVDTGGRTHILSPVDDHVFLDKDNKLRLTFDIEKNSTPTVTCAFLDGKTFTLNATTPEPSKSDESSEAKQYSSTATLALNLKMDLSDRIKDKIEQTSAPSVENNSKPLSNSKEDQLDSETKEEGPKEKPKFFGSKD